MSWWQKIASLAIALLVMGCGAPSRLATFVDLGSDEWCSPSEVHFTIEPGDTVELFSLQLHARYGKSGSSDKLEMMLCVTAPDGVQWSEPYTMALPAARKPQQLSSAIYRKGIKWGQCGEYTITFSPLHIYRGVSSIGVELINTK